MKVSRKWLILAVFFLVINMAIATQYALTKVDYEYYIEKIGNEKYIYINFWKIKKIEKEGYYEIKH